MKLIWFLLPKHHNLFILGTPCPVPQPIQLVNKFRMEQPSCLSNPSQRRRWIDRRTDFFHGSACPNKQPAGNDAKALQVIRHSESQRRHSESVATPSGTPSQSPLRVTARALRVSRHSESQQGHSESVATPSGTPSFATRTHSLAESVATPSHSEGTPSQSPLRGHSGSIATPSHSEGTPEPSQ